MLTTILTVSMLVSAAGLLDCSNTRSHSNAPIVYRTKTGKTITVLETQSVGQSLSTIKISTSGFEHNFHKEYKDRDPVSDVFMADLDDNGFDEIYIITTKINGE